jgi:hypothetical protein
VTPPASLSSVEIKAEVTLSYLKIVRILVPAPKTEYLHIYFNEQVLASFNLFDNFSLLQNQLSDEVDNLSLFLI